MRDILGNYDFINENVSIEDIEESDNIIMSDEKIIKPRNISQKTAGFGKDGIGFKPKGLWYAFGSGWIDWVDGNMPEWKGKYLHKIQLDYRKILVLDKYGWGKFEKKYGVSNKAWNDGRITDITWDYVQEDGWYGIEVDDPYGMIGTWERTWSVSSGCIWDKRAIKRIIRL